MFLHHLMLPAEGNVTASLHCTELVPVSLSRTSTFQEVTLMTKMQNLEVLLVRADMGLCHIYRYNTVPETKKCFVSSQALHENLLPEAFLSKTQFTSFINTQPKEISRDWGHFVKTRQFLNHCARNNKLKLLILLRETGPYYVLRCLCVSSCAQAALFGLNRFELYSKIWLRSSIKIISIFDCYRWE